ncbi:cadherin-23-like isoform X1 [Octopus vulgaris]|uniref:Cadherin-23-like isoform X1 n=1 Tax=Octopus vulgaris TaxID=6645 RepID=A0AA36EZS1_OCTVU|nr:cadherin-23-like isoform X1 [Octopus vulgaris]
MNIFFVMSAATSNLPQKIKVKENQKNGTVVATVEVTGNNFPKLTLKGDILNYLRVVDNLSCTNTASCNKFDLVTIKVIDRENVPNGYVEFTPEFTDGSVGNICYLIILDENDNGPVFGSQRYKATIPENITVNTKIPNLQITATDIDENPSLKYSLIPAGQNSKGIEDYMKIEDKYNGFITVVKALDYETRNFFEYTVEVFGTLITTVTAEDQDRGIPNDIRYKIIKDSCSSFSISNDSGEVRIKSDNLDRENTVINKLDGVCTVEIKAYEIKNNKIGDSVTKNITIFVEDVNDNDPFFNKNSFTAKVNENTTKDNPVTINEIITVKDNDTVEYSKFSLSLKTLDGKPFTALKVIPVESVTETNVALSVNNTDELDYEKRKQMTFKIVAEDKASSKSSEANVTLELLPVDEFLPQFSQQRYQVNVSEDKTVGNLITINATDDDLGKDGEVTYAIFGDNSFTIDSKSGTISVLKKLDYEKVTFYSLLVEATDGGNRKATVDLDVFVEGINDNAPIFRPKFYTGLLKEGKTSFEYEITVQATDADKENSGNSQVKYSIVNASQGLSNSFSINAQNGIITPSNIDYENLTDNVIQLVVKAEDNGIPVKEDTAVVNITVLDVNDNEPQFQECFYNISIKENLTADSWLLNVTAKDDDKTSPFNRVNFRLKTQTSVFRINSEDGSIFLSSKLNREYKSFYNLTVLATDGGTPSKTATTEVNVIVEDVNDETPELILGKTNIELYENITINSYITSINATDKDLNSKLIFNISQETIEINGKGREVNKNTIVPYFEIDHNTGNITLKEKLDRETFERIILKVEVSDQNTVVRVGTATGFLTITVKDINDCYPVFRENFTLLNLVENYPVGSIIATLTATDDDKNDFVTYEVLDSSNKFGINNKTGEISLKAELDREENPNITFNVVASDSLLPTLSSTATVFVVVEDFNDNAPEFQNLDSILPVPENTSVNTIITTITTTDKDIGIHANVSYTLTVSGGNSPFKIDKITGEIVLISELDREAVDKYTVIITALDNYDYKNNFQKPGWKENTTTILINVTDVNDNPPVFKSDEYSKNVQESISTGTILTVATTDEDIGENGKVQYSLQGKESVLFKMDPGTGVLSIASDLTNKIGVKCFNVTAKDEGNPPLSSTTSICINITDINNNNPKFEKPNDTITIPESTCPDTRIYKINIKDEDFGVNAEINYELESKADNSNFKVDKSGNVILRKQLDYEKKTTYEVQIKASDSGTPSLPSIPTVFLLSVKVTNINDEPPEFLQPNDTFTIKEGPPPIATGSVKAKDSGFDLCYTIDDTESASYFVLKNDSNAALIETKKGVDYETTKFLKLVVVVQNCIEVTYNASCPKSPSPDILNKMNVDVVIQDADDNPPIFTEKAFSKAIIFDISKEEKILELEYYVNDADTDPKNKQHKYFIESFEYFGNDALKQLKTPFEIRNSGIYRKADLDSSVSGYIQMLIKANDTNGLDTTATVKIHILSEANEVKIVFTKAIDEVRSQNPEFIKFLQSVVGEEYEIVPGKLDVPQNGQGEPDPLRTSLILYAVNNATKQVVPAKDLLKKLNHLQLLTTMKRIS